MAIIGFVTARPILVLLDTDPVILNDAVAYLKVVSIGIVCVGFYNGVSGILRALGDSKSSLFSLLWQVDFKCYIGLDFCINALAGALLAAGVATAFSQLISALACIIYAYKSNTYFKLKKKNIKLNGNIIKKSCKLGIPVALQNSLIAFSLIVLQKVVNGYGATFTTAFTVVSRIETLVQQPFMSLGAAVSTYTGQNIGAGLKDRVRKGLILQHW